MLELSFLVAMTVLLSSFFALIEATIIYVDDIKLNKILKKDIKNKKYIKEIIKNKKHYLTTATMLNTTVNVAGSSLISVYAANVFGLNNWKMLAFTALLTYGILVFSKILPKVIAINNYEKILEKTAFFNKVLKVICTPFVYLIIPWLKLVKNKNKKVSMKDLTLIIDYYSKKGLLLEEQNNLMHKIFAMKEKRVEDLVSDYKDGILYLDSEESINTYKKEIIASKSKRYIVRENEQIIGIAFHRDVSNQLMNKNKECKTRDCMYEAATLSGDLNVIESLRALKEAEKKYAIIENEEHQPIAIVSEKQLYSYSMKL